MFLLTGTFIGLVILIYGFTMLLELFFKVKFPTVKTLISVSTIYLGAAIMSTDLRFFSGEYQQNTVIFMENTLMATESNRDYHVVFAKGNIDFTQMKTDKGNIYVEVNTVLAKTVIYVKSDMPVRIIYHPSIAYVRYPDGRGIFPIKKTAYKTPKWDDNAKAITIRINIAFGLVDIIER